MSQPWYHVFHKIAERLFCYEIRLHGEDDLIKKYEQVFPRNMANNEVMIHQWLPPRKDPKTGELLETHRIRIFRVPVGKNGPRPAEICRILDDQEVPKEVRMPDALEIPAVLKSLKNPAECEVIAARMGVTISPDMDIRAVHTLLAMAANSTEKAKDVLNKMMEQSKAEPAAV